MSYILHGNQLTFLVEEERSSIQVDETGKATASVTYTGKWPEAVAQAYSIYRHPDFPELTRRSFKGDRDSPCLAKITIEFSGVVESDDGEGVGIHKKYSLKGSTGQDPIETHKDFTTGFGGLPTPGAKGTNEFGASFDETGKFTGFAAEDIDHPYYGGDPNHNKAGVKSYFAPGVVYSEVITYSRSAAAAAAAAALTVTKLGKIDTPPSSALLPSVGTRTWLLSAVNADEQGEGLVISKEWRLSGERGWDTEVYIYTP